jgi:peptidoglycan/LPS O-acetylase OafA/YrhL
MAILLVLGRHAEYYHLWQRAGWIGVDLFFVLSGFLISNLLFSEYGDTGTINLGRFLLRRGLKIYPAYYFFVLLWLPFNFHRLKLSDLLFMQSYFPGYWGHGWSLSVEEHFYLLLPLILLFSIWIVPHSRFAWIPYACPVVILACLAMRVLTMHGDVARTINYTHLRFDGLFAGVTLGWLRCFYPSALQLTDRYRNALAFFGLVLASGAFFLDQSDPRMYTVGLTANLVGFSALLVCALNSPSLGGLRPLARIGFYSYSIYLWHWVISKLLLTSGFVSFWSYAAISIIIGIGAAKLIESPVLQFRDRYFPSRRAVTTGQIDAESHPLELCRS